MYCFIGGNESLTFESLFLGGSLIFHSLQTSLFLSFNHSHTHADEHVLLNYLLECLVIYIKQVV